MAVIRQEVTVAAVSSEWLADVVAGLHGVAENVRLDAEGRPVLPALEALPDLAAPDTAGPRAPGAKGPGAEQETDLRLVEGAHLRPGARYRLRTRDGGSAGAETVADITVDSWDPASATVLRVAGTATEGGGAYTFDGVLTARGGALPPSVEAEGALHADALPLARLLGSSASVGARIAPHPPGATAAPLATADLAHRLVTARCALTPLDVSGGRCRVSVEIAVRGRSWVRPLVAVALLLARRRIGEALAAFLAEAAETAWDPVAAEVDVPAELAALGTAFARAAHEGDGATGPHPL